MRFPKVSFNFKILNPVPVFRAFASFFSFKKIIFFFKYLAYLFSSAISSLASNSFTLLCSALLNLRSSVSKTTAALKFFAAAPILIISTVLIVSFFTILLTVDILKEVIAFFNSKESVCFFCSSFRSSEFIIVLPNTLCLPFK